MRWLQMISWILLFSLAGTVKADEKEGVGKLLEEVKNKKVSTRRMGKSIRQLRLHVMTEEEGFKIVSELKGSEILMKALNKVTKKTNLKNTEKKYKKDLLWILGRLYEKNCLERMRIRKLAEGDSFFELLNFFEENKTENKSKLQKALVSTLRNRGLTKKQIENKLPILVRVLKNSLKQKDVDSKHLAYVLISFFRTFISSENGDFLMASGVTQALGGAHTYPDKAVRDLTKRFLEDLQPHISDRASRVSQRKNDWKRFWDNLKIDFGLKEKRPQIKQINLGPLEEAHKILRRYS